MNSFLLTSGPSLTDAPLTYLILAITVYTSYRMMENHYEKDVFMFNPYTIKSNKEWYRFFSHGLIHADWIHLLFNAYVLFSFGAMVEMAFKMYIFGELLGPIMYLILYISGLFMSSLYSYYKHQNNPRYNALGASGAVSSIVFTYILLAPTSGMGLIFIPGLYFPAIIFGLAYLAYSAYMSKKGRDNIGHDAHYWGSVWGFIFPVVMKPILLVGFLNQIRDYFTSIL